MNINIENKQSYIWNRNVIGAKRVGTIKWRALNVRPVALFPAWWLRATYVRRTSNWRLPLCPTTIYKRKSCATERKVYQLNYATENVTLHITSHWYVFLSLNERKYFNTKSIRSEVWCHLIKTSGLEMRYFASYRRGIAL